MLLRKIFGTKREEF